MKEKKSTRQDKEGIINLPSPSYRGTVSVEESLLLRRSVRDYENRALTLQQVSQLLWAAYGVTKEISSPSFLRGGLKTAPSAGALYPLEIYLVAGDVEGLPAGIYKFIPAGHQLELIIEEDVRKSLARAAYNQTFVGKAPVALFYSAIYERTTRKYGERGRSRYVCMDLGHSAQNVYLQAVAMGLGTCAVGAFNNEMVSNVMMLPRKEEPLYIMPVGYPGEKARIEHR
ncbi:SagB/ThcOx family dehydrogenase [Marinilabiliaceae bacterium JC017]|nr:SagB/ThcOx family dehydrogenase [Marinilabiliaceae bacterium JC017]